MQDLYHHPFSTLHVKLWSPKTPKPWNRPLLNSRTSRTCGCMTCFIFSMLVSTSFLLYVVYIVYIYIYIHTVFYIHTYIYIDNVSRYIHIYIHRYDLFFHFGFALQAPAGKEDPPKRPRTGRVKSRSRSPPKPRRRLQGGARGGFIWAGLRCRA